MTNLQETSLLLDNYYINRIKKFNTLKNLLFSDITFDENEELFCDTLIVMLYAQLEGYVTDLFLYLLEEINGQKLKFKDVNQYICAASKSNCFESLEDHIKNKNKYNGRIKFISEINDFWEETIKLNNSLVNTKNNLKENVLKELMLKLGLPKDNFSVYAKMINEFVDIRNDVAHGNENKRVVVKKGYQQYEDLIINTVMIELKDMIFDFIKNKAYLRE